MARRHETDDFRFEGFESPNTTPVPDVVFDRLLSRLGEAELKALLYIIRRTFGFKRDRDSISFNQFMRGITTREGRILDEGCGVRSRTTLSGALKSLEEKGIVLSDKGVDDQGENVTTIYRLRFRDAENAAREDRAGVVRISHHPGTNFAPPVVRNSYPQETGLQQTEKRVSNIRKGSFQDQKAADAAASGITSASAQERLVNEPRLTPAELVPPPTAPADKRQLQPRGAAAPRRLRAVPHQDENYQLIQSYMADFSRELNDRASLKTSTTRAYNLFRRSGLSPDAFVAQLYAARAIVKERVGAIRAQEEATPSGLPRKRQAAYFFAVLEDLLDAPPSDA